MTRAWLSEETVKGLKTMLWSAFWLSLAFFVDTLVQALAGFSLPNIDTDVFGLSPVVFSINTSLVVGLLLNRLSKMIHNYRNRFGSN